jgi:hypothetical protein
MVDPELIARGEDNAVDDRSSRDPSVTEEAEHIEQGNVGILHAPNERRLEGI